MIIKNNEHDLKNDSNRDDIEDKTINIFDDPTITISPEKFGITDNLYLDTGIDLRWLKRFNPKNHVIF